MRSRLQYFICTAMLIFTVNTFGADCLNCPGKVVAGMPVNSSLEALEKILKGGVTSDLDIAKIRGFCFKFSSIPQELVGVTIKELESTTISIENYFTQPLCQPTAYSNVVQSPIMHIIAEDPTKREEFLQNIWLYYSKKRKEPEIFNQIINAKNTKGETLLDYIETIRLRGLQKEPTQIIAIAKIKEMLCRHGGVYITQKDVKCPQYD